MTIPMPMQGWLGCGTSGIHEDGLRVCFAGAAEFGFRLYLVEGVVSPRLPQGLPFLIIHPDDEGKLPTDEKGSYLGTSREGYSVWRVAPDDVLLPLKVLRASDSEI